MTTNLKFRIKNSGFTLLELILVMAIISILAAFVTISLLAPQQQASIAGAADTLISDIKSQQLKAMAGQSNLISGLVYGVHVENNRYVLFQGPSYDAGSASNFPVVLTSGLTLSTTIAGPDLSFNPISGEVSIPLTPGADTITISDQYGLQKTITINQLGTITIVN